MLIAHNSHPGQQHAQIQKVQRLEKHFALLATIFMLFEFRMEHRGGASAPQSISQYVNLGEAEGNIVQLLHELQGQDVVEDGDDLVRLDEDHEDVYQEKVTV